MPRHASSPRNATKRSKGRYSISQIKLDRENKTQRGREVKRKSEGKKSPVPLDKTHHAASKTISSVHDRRRRRRRRRRRLLALLFLANNAPAADGNGTVVLGHRGPATARSVGVLVRTTDATVSTITAVAVVRTLTLELALRFHATVFIRPGLVRRRVLRLRLCLLPDRDNGWVLTW